MYGGCIRLSGRDLAVFLDMSVSDVSCRVRVFGASMHPLIRNGETLTLASPKSLISREGDIAAVDRGESAAPVIHRIISSRKKAGATWFLIKGDNCMRSDGWFPEDRILGIVVSAEKSKAESWPFSSWGKKLLAILSVCGILCPVIRLVGLKGRVLQNTWLLDK